MFTPDALNLWGNAVGNIGMLALLILVSGMLVHLTTLHSFRQLYTGYPDGGGHHGALRTQWGRPAADVVLFCAKVPFTLGISTGLLVSAGFIFNETFVYWFPNFAFAFFLLGGVLLVNLLGEAAVRWSQILAMFGVFIGLLILITSSLSGEHPQIRETPSLQLGNSAYMFCGALFLMGFDLAFHGKPRSGSELPSPWRCVSLAIALGAIVLALWGWIGSIYVPHGKLAQTTISHLYIARSLMGQVGRLIMGTIVICAVFAAVNALLFNVSRILSELMGSKGDDSPPDMETGPKRTPRLALVILASTIALIMASGWAGEPVLETFIHSGIIFWLAHYGLVNLTALRLNLSQMSTSHNLFGRISRGVVQGYALFGLFLAIVGIFLLEQDPKTLVLLMLAVPVITGIVMGVPVLMRGTRIKNRSRTARGLSHNSNRK